MKVPVVAKKGFKCVHYQELRNFYQEKCKKYAIRIRISRIVVVSLLSVLSLSTPERPSRWLAWRTSSHPH